MGALRRICNSYTPRPGSRYFAAGYCANCDRPVPKLFCSELCQQMAETIRYARRKLRDGTFDRPDVSAAIKTRIALIVHGGYPRKKRYLSQPVRQEVLARDDSRCQICGAPGNEIDHISGNSNELSNLRIVCHDCHAQKTQAAVAKPTTLIEMEVVRVMERRYRAPEPERLCDDEQAWEHRWPALRKDAQQR